MGLREYLNLGAKLTRGLVSVQTNDSGSGSVEIGSAYALLSIQSSFPCRLRLYDTLASLEDAGEISRNFGNTSVSDSIALIGDFTMSAGIYTIDPLMYGVTTPANTKLTYYRIDNTGSAQYPNLTFRRYLLEDSSISTANRILLPPITGSLGVGQIVSGTIATEEIPKTYLLLSASLSAASSAARVRLYSTLAPINNVVEKNRLFVTESQIRTLLVDAIITGSEIMHFVPKIIGVNLDDLGTSLRTITIPTGKNELYYIFQSMATTGGTQDMTASIHVLSLED